MAMQHRSCNSILVLLLAVTTFVLADEQPQQQKCLDSCGNIQVKHPFGYNEDCGSFPYNQLLSCDGRQLRLRSSSGAFDVQHVDYDKMTMTITDRYSKSICSDVSTTGGFSPDMLLLHPTSHNILVLFDCPAHASSAGLCTNISKVDCDALYSNCNGNASVSLNQQRSCCVTDFDRLGKNGLKESGCPRYASLFGLDGGGWGYGLRVSFDVLPDRVPTRLCSECQRPDGNCGVALRCICFPHECKNNILSGTSLHLSSPLTLMSLTLLLLIVTGFGI